MQFTTMNSELREKLLERYDETVVRGKLIKWQLLPVSRRIKNRGRKALTDVYYRLGLFDFSLSIERKKEKYRRWKNGDSTHHNF